MKILYLVFVLVVAILAVIFAAQNGAVVAISFFSWSASGSLSLVLILTLSLGILIGLLIMAPSVFRRWFQSSGLRRRLKRLEKERGAEPQAAMAGRGARSAAPSAPASPAPSEPSRGEGAPTAGGSADTGPGA